MLTFNNIPFYRGLPEFIIIAARFTSKTLYEYIHLPFGLYYIRNQRDATLAVLFINSCKNTLHVSDVYRVHHQEYTNCNGSQWCMSWVGMMYIQ